MDWWVLEVIQVSILIAFAFGLHRVIRRSGESYANELFSASPEVGRRFLILADIAFYLIFAAYTMFNLQLQNELTTVDAGQIEEVLYSAGGIALIIGLLHLVNVVFLPVVSRLLTSQDRVATSVGVNAGNGSVQKRMGSLLLTVNVDSE